MSIYEGNTGNSDPPYASSPHLILDSLVSDQKALVENLRWSYTTPNFNRIFISADMEIWEALPSHHVLKTKMNRTRVTERWNRSLLIEGSIHVIDLPVGSGGALGL